MPEQFTDTLSDTLGLGLAIGDAYAIPASITPLKGYINISNRAPLTGPVHQVTDLTLLTAGTTATGGSIAVGDTLVLVCGVTQAGSQGALVSGFGFNSTTVVSTSVANARHDNLIDGIASVAMATVTTVPTSIYVGLNSGGTLIGIKGGSNEAYEAQNGIILVFGGGITVDGTPTATTFANGVFPSNQTVTGLTTGMYGLVIGGGGGNITGFSTPTTNKFSYQLDYGSNIYTSAAIAWQAEGGTFSPIFTGTSYNTLTSSATIAVRFASSGGGVTYAMADQNVEQMTTSETTTPAVSSGSTLVDSFTTSGTSSVQWRLGQLLAETMAMSIVTVSGSSTGVLATDTLNATDTATMGRPISVADTLQLAEAITLHNRYPRTVLDTLTVTERLRTALTAFAADGMAFSEDTLFKLGGLIMREQMRVADQPIPNTITRMLVSELLRVSDRLRAGLPVAALDQVSVSYALQVFRGIAIAERLGLADSLLARARTGLTLSDQVNFYDSLRRFFAADAADQMTVTEALASLRRAVSVATDAVTLGDVASPKMLLRVTSRDQLSLTDAQALRMIFKPDLDDSVEIAGAYVAPDGNLTTWAVNTRTGATTEYTGYNFNSFTRMGLRYLGANATGLYELDGDDDAGTDIIAAMKGGFLQFNGSRFAGMKAVYLGIRGEGEFFLKLEAGTGETYTYKVIAEKMETSKVWIGKGLRHRYISYELISTGQDFDLESIEFVPMLAQRRV